MYCILHIRTGPKFKFKSQKSNCQPRWAWIWPYIVNCRRQISPVPISDCQVGRHKFEICLLRVVHTPKEVMTNISKHMSFGYTCICHFPPPQTNTPLQGVSPQANADTFIHFKESSIERNGKVLNSTTLINCIFAFQFRFIPVHRDLCTYHSLV